MATCGDDARDEELKYLEARDRLLRQELDESLGAMSGQSGTAAAPDPITPDAIAALAALIVRALHDAGHRALAAEYTSVMEIWKEADERLQSLLLHMQARPTPGDEAALESAQEAVIDATEHFERVQAQVEASLERRVP
jgi:hypothetical protein